MFWLTPILPSHAKSLSGVTPPQVKNHHYFLAAQSSETAAAAAVAVAVVAPPPPPPPPPAALTEAIQPVPRSEFRLDIRSYHTLVVNVLARCYSHRSRLWVNLCFTIHFLGQGLKPVKHLSVLD